MILQIIIYNYYFFTVTVVKEWWNDGWAGNDYSAGQVASVLDFFNC